VHVAGTNGKGSCSAKMAASLHYAGKRVGLFTSPHLLSFCERIWALGSMISEEVMSRYLRQVERAAVKIGVTPTFFELLTLIAFLHFAAEGVEIAVVEVGLGGRLDATNIVQPRLAVITSIGLDHTEYLGDTLEEIAYEKAGIIKPGCAVVLGGSVRPTSLFERIAFERGCSIQKAAYRQDFELQNQETAKAALSLLSCEGKGLHVRPWGRFLRRGDVIIDVAHNEPALAALFLKIEEPFTAVAAFSCSKKAPAMARLLQAHATKLYVTKAHHERGVEPPHIEGAILVDDVKEALTLAKQRGGLLLVCGTFFMMEEVFSFFDIEAPKGPFYD